MDFPYQDIPGLLDPTIAQNARTQGLLGAAQGLLAGGAPSPMPGAFGRALAGGLGGGTQGYQQGIGLGMQQQQLLQKQQGIASTYQALKGQGVPDETARAAALNPNILGMMPDWKQIGLSKFGQPVYGFVNRLTGTTGQGSGNWPGGGGGGGANEAPATYESLDKNDQKLVDALIEGRQSLTGAQLKMPYWNTLLDVAQQRAQDRGIQFDQTNYGARTKTHNDYSSAGKSGQSLNAIDTVQGHMEKLSNAVERLDNSSWPAWNVARNFISQQTGFDQAHRDALNEVKNSMAVVSRELTRAYQAGHITDTDMKDWQDKLNSVQSKQDMQRALVDFHDLLGGKRQQLYDTYKQQMGGLELSRPDADAKWHKVEGLLHGRFLQNPAAAQPQQGVTPTGKTGVYPEGTIIFNKATNHRQILKNGEWTDYAG